MRHVPYLPFLLIWALPVVALQWLVGWRYLWRERRHWPWIVAGLGAYFWLADAVAIAAGVWSFDERSLIGLYLGPVPIEEILFYLLTSAMVVQGFVLFQAAMADKEAIRERFRQRIDALRRLIERWPPHLPSGDAHLPSTSTESDGDGSQPKIRPPTRNALNDGRGTAGIWAILLAFALPFLLAGILAVPTPLEPLTEFIMQATPISLANVLIGALGPFAQTFALLGAIAVTLAIGGLLGLVAPPLGAARPQLASLSQAMRSTELRRRVATSAVAVLATLPLFFAASFRAAGILALLAGLLYVPALLTTRHLYCAFEMHLRNRRQHAVEPSSPGLLSRRTVMRGAAQSAVTVAGALALGSFQWWSSALAPLFGRAEQIRTIFAFKAPAPRQQGFPVAGVAPEVTPVERFYIMGKNDIDPLIAPADWSLRITGQVSRRLSLAYGELAALPRIDEYVTLRCVSNLPQTNLMSTALWSGVPIAQLLNKVGVRSGAQGIVLHAPDGYDETVPLATVLNSTSLLAYGMNGETLPRRHGGPVRAILPGYFGFKNIKWIEAIEVVSEIPKGYWAQRGYTASEVHSVARIDVWRAEPGGVLAAGVAFGGTPGISAVQARVDDGPWIDADLDTPPLSPMTWVLWRITLPLRPGTYRLTARMIDGKGQPQDRVQRGVFPNGATGLHSVDIHL